MVPVLKNTENLYRLRLRLSKESKLGLWFPIQMILPNVLLHLGIQSQMIPRWYCQFKRHFCAHGDTQIQGIDFFEFETYSLVVQWTTICLMLVLECIFGLCSKQGDMTCAFLHASLRKDEVVYIEMPQGFKQYDKNGKPKVLKLNQTLYGLHQYPCVFWLFLTEKLE